MVGAITSFQNAATASQIQIAVAKKALDAQRQEGDAALQLLQAASTTTTQPAAGMGALASGLGGRIDIYG